MATGFEKPSIDFLPSDLFPMEGTRNYSRPNLYLQTFSTEDWSILLTNSAYENAIAVVGNWHIGIYARILVGKLSSRISISFEISRKFSSFSDFFEYSS